MAETVAAVQKALEEQRQQNQRKFEDDQRLNTGMFEDKQALTKKMLEDQECQNKAFQEQQRRFFEHQRSEREAAERRDLERQRDLRVVAVAGERDKAIRPLQDAKREELRVHERQVARQAAAVKEDPLSNPACREAISKRMRAVLAADPDEAERFQSFVAKRHEEARRTGTAPPGNDAIVRDYLAIAVTQRRDPAGYALRDAVRDSVRESVDGIHRAGHEGYRTLEADWDKRIAKEAKPYDSRIFRIESEYRPLIDTVAAGVTGLAAKGISHVVGKAANGAADLVVDGTGYAGLALGRAAVDSITDKVREWKASREPAPDPNVVLGIKPG